jgi:hypothetical protein
LPDNPIFYIQRPAGDEDETDEKWITVFKSEIFEDLTEVVF